MFHNRRYFTVSLHSGDNYHLPIRSYFLALTTRREELTILLGHKGEEKENNNVSPHLLGSNYCQTQVSGFLSVSQIRLWSLRKSPLLLNLTPLCTVQPSSPSACHIPQPGPDQSETWTLVAFWNSLNGR